MNARRALPVRIEPEPVPTHLCGCGNPWIACAPGSAEHRTSPDGAQLLHPIPAIDSQFWCLSCWTWSKQKFAEAV